MIPEAWEKHATMDPKRHAFYEYHAAMMEPWDGPAAVAFTDGRQIGATLDRNGLRPARYLVTKDDLVVMASESGVLPIEDSRILKKWRLQPGKMFLIDMEQGRIIDDSEIKNSLATAKPYSEWINKIRIKIGELDERSGNVAPIAHAHWTITYESTAGVTDAKCSNCGFASLAYENDVHTDEDCNNIPDHASSSSPSSGSEGASFRT